MRLTVCGRCGAVAFVASEIEGRIRGFDPWPGVWVRRGRKRLRLVRGAAVEERVENEPAGTLVGRDGGLSLVCGGGSLLRLEQREISKMRTRLRAFHPRGEMRVLTPAPQVFAVVRTSPEGDRRVLALTNVTGEVVRVECRVDELGVSDTSWYDLVAGEHWHASGETLSVELGPYDVVWLVPTRERLEDRRAGR